MQLKLTAVILSVRYGIQRSLQSRRYSNNLRSLVSDWRCSRLRIPFVRRVGRFVSSEWEILGSRHAHKKDGSERSALECLIYEYHPKSDYNRSLQENNSVEIRVKSPAPFEIVHYIHLYMHLLIIDTRVRDLSINGF